MSKVIGEKFMIIRLYQCDDDISISSFLNIHKNVYNIRVKYTKRKWKPLPFTFRHNPPYFPSNIKQLTPETVYVKQKITKIVKFFTLTLNFLQIIRAIGTALRLMWTFYHNLPIFKAFKNSIFQSNKTLQQNIKQFSFA